MIKVILQNTLLQITDLLEQLHQEEYTQKDELLSGSSIGMHTRHIIEFVQCVIHEDENCTVCYDNRKRDERLQSSPILAKEAIENILESLGSIDELKRIKLVGCYGTDSHHDFTIDSTIQRELAYNIEHAIHHMAIIKIAVKQLFPDVSLPENFGIAHSTVRHGKVHQA